MTKLVTIRRHAPSHARGLCKVETATVTTSCATEIFARCAPLAAGNSRNGCRLQAQAIYESLAAMLEQLGGAMGHVVIEKAFLRKVVADFHAFEEARIDAYRRHGISGQRLPATTYLGQPPCMPGQDVELQVYAVVPTSPGSARVQHLSPANEHVTVKLVEIGQVRHLYISNVSGEGRDHVPLGPFRRQSDVMFDTALEVLRENGTSFRDVLRTWIYLDDIDRDYQALNDSRNAFFQREDVRRLPASTGIGGKLHPRGTLCTLDVYALLNPAVAQVEVMHTPTLNDAPQYGSSFSRGMKMALPEQTYLFISGTASVDECGRTAHVGDVRGQLERMLLNIEGLLTPQGATWADLVQGVTFLKSPDYAELYRELCEERGMVELPHTIVQADICRPELLSEMEAIAVVPNRRA
jgi:enamine deaminase RidA (YjgF/YER057c/UK114 family)